ncbi:L-fucose isomerase [Candidatus Moduliflexus flocculans]|uniref:L-fucose isomerase n=1 Tax=Candidatus Moduliflexus flocculans TaxID=1499966 RepID=A0A0S6W045_9BACT|nr:L-fucose isomerase [Candidatus Moduliflexus flocculans]
MKQAKMLTEQTTIQQKKPVIGVFSAGDPRIDDQSRERCRNIVKMVADTLADRVTTAEVVYSTILVDSERQADIVAQQFKEAGVSSLVCAPDTWAFPQLSVISLLAHFPKRTPINFTCGNSGPKPGVVFAHATNGAVTQSGILSHLNIGSWPDTGQNPVMTKETADSLVDWAYAAATYQAMKGRRVVVFGHDSMGMETALAHILPTRNIFGLEITRLDMKLLADMLNKQAYNKEEVKALRAWCDKYVKKIELRNDDDSQKLNTSLAMYLIVRDLLKDLNAVGGGFMSQLEWGSDPRGIPLPVADAMESFFNSTFDHNGTKPVMPFATEADVQGLLTMLFFSQLTGGNPPLFMDFRKVWEPKEITEVAKQLGVPLTGATIWEQKGFFDGNNSGSAAFDWAAKPGASVEEIMSRVTFPLQDFGYFPGGGNSVTFLTPGGIEGVVGRLGYNAISGMFSLIWDEAVTLDLPDTLATKVCNTTNREWPHTFVSTKYASMYEFKQYGPANHNHMVWNLPVARLQYWMDFTNVLSVAPWAARPVLVEGVDRSVPLLYLQNGGENATKLMLNGR